MKNDIHLKAPKNWINDPNGFIYYKGKYHLFYQHFPYAPKWGTMHWGHAVSEDLVTWEHKVIALFPSRYEDQNGCFSGSAVEHEGKMYLFYTGVRYEVVDPEDIHVPLDNQFEAMQLMITSEDGFHFDNFKGKQVVVPAIKDEKLGHRTNTRDPKVWRGKDAWYMVLGSTTQEEGGKLLFYRSENLSVWTYVNQISKAHKLGWMWECPDYFEMKDEKVLVFSPMSIMNDGKKYTDQAVCMLVDFDEQTCQMQMPDNYQFVDYGLDLYAPQSNIDSEDRRVVVAWMRMPVSVDDTWNGMFCMPRIVEVKDKHIYFRLHPNLKHAFNKKIESVAQANPVGYCVSLDLKENEWISVGGYLISRKYGKVCTDRSNVWCGLEEYRMELETPEVKEGFHLDVYVDKNLVEVYVNDGEWVISNVVYGLSENIQASVNVKYSLFTVE